MSPEEQTLWERLGFDGEAFEAYFEAQAAAGHDVHGEARFVEQLGVRSVLDGGCGTGRIGRELARRGLEVVGVDLDPAMIAVARRKAPDLDWRLGDLATANLGRAFAAVLLAGNVMLFVAPGSERAIVTNLARHLAPGGLLVAGFQLMAGRITLAAYDRFAEAAGLTLAERYAGWDRQPWRPDCGYAVSVHRRPALPGPRYNDATYRA